VFDGSEPNGRLQSDTRHWGTMTRDLLAMSDWLAAEEKGGMEAVAGVTQ